MRGKGRGGRRSTGGKGRGNHVYTGGRKVHPNKGGNQPPASASTRNPKRNQKQRVRQEFTWTEDPITGELVVKLPAEVTKGPVLEEEDFEIILTLSESEDESENDSLEDQEESVSDQEEDQFEELEDYDEYNDEVFEELEGAENIIRSLLGEDVDSESDYSDSDEGPVATPMTQKNTPKKDSKKDYDLVKSLDSLLSTKIMT